MRSGRIFRGLTVMFFLACLGVSFAGQAPGAGYDEKKVADFYRGKTLRIIVGFSAGGGYDQYSRLIGRHLSKYIPGNPAIQFDMAKFRYLAVPVSETYIFIATKKPGVTKFEELLGPNGKQVVVGGIPGSTVEHAPILFRDILGANVKMVLGYKGTADVRMAIDSGEVDGLFNSYTSLKITSFDKMKSGEWILLAQLGEKPIKDLIVPNIPTIPQLTKNNEHRLLLKFGTSTPNDFGKVYVVPPGTPADRAAALEKAFERVFSDKELQADATKGKLEIDPMIGEDIHKLVVEFLGMSPDLKGKLQAALKGKK